MYTRQDKRQVAIGYNGLAAVPGGGFNFSLPAPGCDPKRAHTCGIDGVCFDEKGCPIAKVSETGKTTLLTDPSKLSAKDKEMYKDTLTDAFKELENRNKMYKMAAIGGGAVVILLLGIFLLRR